MGILRKSLVAVLLTTPMVFSDATLSAAPCAGLADLALSECQHQEATKAKQEALERRRAEESAPKWSAPVPFQAELGYRLCGTLPDRTTERRWIRFFECMHRVGEPAVAIADCGPYPNLATERQWNRYFQCLNRAGVLEPE